MSNAILLHGKPGKAEYFDGSVPSASNNHWFPWLQKQLLTRDIATATPEVPGAWHPVYSDWVKEFERYDVGPDTLLVGHSCGGGFLVRWLSEHPSVQVGKVVLVAPTLGLKWDDRSFFDYTMDHALVSRTAGVTVFASDDDPFVTSETIDRYVAAITGLEVRKFHGYGHFTYEAMHSWEFPELLDELIA